MRNVNNDDWTSDDGCQMMAFAYMILWVRGVEKILSYEFMKNFQSDFRFLCNIANLLP